MVNASPRYWRMAFREGPQGPNHWNDCYRLGVAVIAMRITDDGKPLPDLTNVRIENFKNFMEKHAGLPLTNLDWSFRSFRYEIKPGDMIYAKSGTSLVGRGKVTGGYKYKVNLFRKDGCAYWAHYRNVEWDRDFVPITKFDVPNVFKGSLWTLLELNHRENRLPQLLRFEEGRSQDASSNMNRGIPEAAGKYRLREAEAVEEGHRAIREIEFQIRNRSIIEKAKRVSDGICVVCGFRTETAYRDLSRDCLVGHHLKPLGTARGSRKTAVKDVVVVCPNCHAAMHTETPPLTVMQLKKKLAFSWEGTGDR